MEILLLALQAASALVPTLLSTVNVLSAALAPNNPAPISAKQATGLLGAIEAAAVIAPALSGLAPLVQKALSGTQFNDADLAALKVTADAIDAAVADAVKADLADPAPAPAAAHISGPEVVAVAPTKFSTVAANAGTLEPT